MTSAHRPDLPGASSLSSHMPTHIGEVEAKREILERAIEEHFETLLGWVVRLLRRWNVFERSQARSPGDIAGDVLADACVAVLRHADRFEAGRDPVPWILGFAVNVAKREREHVFKANRAAGERPEVSASELAGEDQNGEDALEEHAARLALSLGLLDSRRATLLETRQALESLLAPLSEDDRQVIVLSVFEGYDSPRLARILGISAPAARKRLQRALDRGRAHIRAQPEHFAWIENLPDLLELRPELRNAEPTAEPPRAHGSKAEPRCHSVGSGAQHPEHDIAPARRAPLASSDGELAHAPSNTMKSRAASHAAPGASKNSTSNMDAGDASGSDRRGMLACAVPGSVAGPEAARLPEQAGARTERGGEPSP